MRIKVIASASLLCLGLAGCVTTPPSEDPVLIKLTEIDERLQKVERLTNNESLLQLASQLEEVQREVREVRGEVETLRFESEGAATRQRDQYLDIDRRLQSLETGGRVTGSVGAGTAAGGAAGAAVGASVAGGSDRASYQAAFDLLKDGRYDQARAGFQQFLADYPNSDLAGHGQYWLGETYYVTQQYPQALPEFQRVIDQYPQSRKLPDALLKVGYCQYELEQYPQARAALEQVVQAYPESTAARLSAQRLDRMKSEGR
jgi:tol-pal system protein YbgF